MSQCYNWYIWRFILEFSWIHIKDFETIELYLIEGKIMDYIK